MHVTNFVTRVTNFVIHVRKFVTKIFREIMKNVCAERENLQAANKIFSAGTKGRLP